MHYNPEEPKTLLIVDDNAMSRTMLRDWVEFIYPTCRVVEAENGKVGLEAAQISQPDLILLDLRMPVMDGYEMALALQEMATTRTIPLVLCTCEDANDPQVAILRNICQEVLTKPFGLTKLEYILTQIIGSSALAIRPMAVHPA